MNVLSWHHPCSVRDINKADGIRNFILREYSVSTVHIDVDRFLNNKESQDNTDKTF